MGQFWTVLSYLHSLAGPSVMLLYPLYASIQAIESTSKLDDEQWLAYWILYSLLTLMEMVAAPVLKWIPIWYQMKVLFVSWLALPQFRGASFMYQTLVREQLKKVTGSIGKDHDTHNKVMVMLTWEMRPHMIWDFQKWRFKWDPLLEGPIPVKSTVPS